MAPLSYSNLATCFSLEGQPNEALKVLNLSLSKNPENSRTYYLRALLNFELNQNDKALKALNKAIKLEPLNTRYLYNLATFYYQNKNFNKSLMIKKE